MLKRKTSTDDLLYTDVPQSPSAKRRLRVARETDPGHESPARRLQGELDLAWNAPTQQWSARKTVAFAVVANGAFWAAMALAVRQIL
jgi:hypothetical protein